VSVAHYLKHEIVTTRAGKLSCPILNNFRSRIAQKGMLLLPIVLLCFWLLYRFRPFLPVTRCCCVEVVALINFINHFAPPRGPVFLCSSSEHRSNIRQYYRQLGVKETWGIKIEFRTVSPYIL